MDKEKQEKEDVKKEVEETPSGIKADGKGDDEEDEQKPVRR